MYYLRFSKTQKMVNMLLLSALTPHVSGSMFRLSPIILNVSIFTAFAEKKCFTGFSSIVEDFHAHLPRLCESMRNSGGFISI